MSDRQGKLFKLFILSLCLSIPILLTACSPPRQAKAIERVFPKLSVEFLSAYTLPKTTFEGTTVGGISAITYDRRKNVYYALSDDRSNLAPARFYTMSLAVSRPDPKNVKIEDVKIDAVTFLKNSEGKTYSPGSIDPEGIALSPRNTVFISSEGIPSKNIPPSIGEYSLTNGQQQLQLRIPKRYLNEKDPENSQLTRGVAENLGFEALTVNFTSSLPDDPFRLFAATESSLLQDIPQEEISAADGSTEIPQPRIRMLHYAINSVGAPALLAEHLYLVDRPSRIVISNGLTELLVFKEKYFLSLERTFGLGGFGAKIFQVVVSNASDTTRNESLAGDISRIIPMRKKLLLDLKELGIKLDNLEGMTPGPILPDGSATLLLVSDDNFREEQVTQFLLFRLVRG